MRRVCFYHGGCPDGFGAAWAVWKAWGERGEYRPRGHDDALDPWDFDGAEVVFVDISAPNDVLSGLLTTADRVTVLDHHVSTRSRYESDAELVAAVERSDHEVIFELDHSGAVLAWQHFGGSEPVPDLLLYVEDQDLWNWKLPESEAVNAAIGSYPHRFDVWDELAARPVAELAAEGQPILRAQKVEVTRLLGDAHQIRIGDLSVEAVNAVHHRSRIGHELAARSAFDRPVGCVYRVVGARVNASLYSIGDLDTSVIASRYDGGGHRNASGFSVPLEDWLRDFV
ncbi:MAG: hypothetical protein O7G30_14065 [Proteobacteria bacterium]|nr:hypothetical protein [Pseudomonadota bacterium]